VKAAFRRSASGSAQSRSQPSQQSRPQESVYGITTADEPLSADIARRQKQYLIGMVFRLVAIAVVIWVPGISWQVKAVLGVIATVIPFFAVVAANGAPTPDHQSTNLLLAAPAPPAIEGRDPSLGPAEEFVAGERVRPDCAGSGRFDGEGWSAGPGRAAGPDQAADRGRDPIRGETG
jgi:Protein of unknown function (DUF3099)